MAISFSLLGRCYTRNHKQINTNHPTLNYHKKPYLKACLASPQGDFLSRRNVIISALTIYYTTLIGTNPIKAEEDTQIKDGENNEEGGGVIGAIKSIFDPNEKTKSGKVLPKAYLKAAREVVKTLRESLEEDTNDITKFRRSADAAKESIREYLGGWRGQSTIAAEESYVALERAIRSLAEFYSKAGPSALLSNEVKSRILDDLKTAEEYL
ncbi:photosystem II D1 precursor processing protein PSB27-H2 [Carex littledalei]|uniref:Photosystem II D1 processing protein PSB27-H2 n=1 Tax=Carex littledalei TaxID=544730 RepID=A0A833V3Y4_9POAL|nr:photosystem II D1 precursor processing protein PSB27-H2 [Carex littledalei]